MSLMAIITISTPTLSAQETSTTSESKRIEELEASLEELTKKFEAAESAKAAEAEKSKKSSFYSPTVFGAILAYYNVSGYSGDQRFAIRNAHLGVKGNASRDVSYQIQINLHNLGSISMLDSWIMYKRGRFNAVLGQQFIHLTADFDRGGPKSNIFTTRSYGIVYVTGYTNGTTVKTLGNRDIGLYTNYTFSTNVPITVTLAALNGAGANQVSWNNDINILGRIQIGGSKGLCGGASVYGGRTPYLQDVRIYSAEARYVTDKLFVEVNYQDRELREDSSSPYESISTGLVQAYYTFKLPKSKIFDNVAPAIRYDFVRNANYSNSISEIIEKLDANRITTQISFNLAEAKIRSRFSIGYEKVIMRNIPSDIASNTLFQDKFTVGMTVAF